MIRTRGLAYAHAGRSVPLRFPDVDLSMGQTLLLRGPSGSGKSTWLALVAGLRTPQAGQITVAGQDLAALRGAALDRWRAATVGIVPQRLHLSAALTVADNLALAYLAAGRPRDNAAIHRTLDALGVAALGTRLPHQLSGGQAQRVAVARAVLLGPSLLVADEPTASLDDAAAQDTLALLERSASLAGASLVIATHDTRVATALPSAATLVLPTVQGAAV
ncbi:ABC transporter ATP-binding protein [Acidovorax lacteus]|uniref:ABC transporter ATP-binding protein n=1 Tax=Acidovorax lacteus TaxID=1924988 RepID=A0ABP8L2U5_9BURK